jgi:hypothetical protein
VPDCAVLVVNLSPRFSECCVCGVILVDCQHGIPCYEGRPVPPDWKGPWAGRDACLRCFGDYETTFGIAPKDVGQEETGEIGNCKSCGTQGAWPPDPTGSSPARQRGDPWCGFNTPANSCPASLLER